jgi:hypothetical protein
MSPNHLILWISLVSQYSQRRRGEYHLVRTVKWPVRQDDLTRLFTSLAEVSVKKADVE